MQPDLSQQKVGTSLAKARDLLIEMRFSWQQYACPYDSTIQASAEQTTSSLPVIKAWLDASHFSVFFISS